MGVILPLGARGVLKPGFVQTQLPSQFAVPFGLVGYWGLDPDCLDFTNNLALDLSAQGNTGTLSTLATTALRNGQVGTSLQFDGVASKIAISSVLSLISATGNYSLCGWFSISGNAANQEMISFGNTGASSQLSAVFISSTGVVGFQTRDDTSSGTVVSSGAGYNDGKWHFYAGVKTGATWSIYVDGVQFTGGSGLNGTTTFNTANIGVLIRTSSVNWFAGLLDETSIYNRALDPWEVVRLYQAGLAGRRDALDYMPSDADLPAAFAALSDSIGSRIVATNFTRKRWRELQAAIAAQEALERRAEGETGKRKRALAGAAKAAERALASIEEDEAAAKAAELAKLTRALEAAAGAASLVETFKRAAQVRAAIRALRQAEDDDEEDAIALLLQ
jgi:hypothetical protein